MLASRWDDVFLRESVCYMLKQCLGSLCYFCLVGLEFGGAVDPLCPAVP